MKKIGIGTFLSIALNFFLFFWLVEQYISDLYFQSYVNSTLGPISPFIILTLGVGGGSGLGFFLLKRRHEPSTFGPRTLKPKIFRPLSGGGTVASPSSSSANILSKSIQSGTVSATSSKHTAYSVPSLSKSSTSSGSKNAPSSTSWSMAKSSPNTNTSFPQRIDPLTKALQQSPSSRTDEVKPTPILQSSQSRVDNSVTSNMSGANSNLDRTSNFRPNPVPSWRQEAPSTTERRPEPSSTFQKPGMETFARQSAAMNMATPSPSGSVRPIPSPPTISKWNPPSPPETSKPSPPVQWSSNTSRQDSPPPVPSKWAPPGNPSGTSTGLPPSPVMQQQSPSSQVQGMPQRPSGILPQRPNPFPAAQNPPPVAPRPFVYQGPRLGEPRPMGVPRPFGPDQNRPPLPPPSTVGPNPRPMPPQMSGRTLPSSSSTIAPMPQPWSPTSQTQDNNKSSTIPSQSSTSNSTELRPTIVSETPASPTSPATTDGSNTSGGGEMDWDTALDTILKTLRKDRVGDKA